MLLWCAYNQRFSRVKDSTVPLESPAMKLNGGVPGSATLGAKKRMALKDANEEATDLSKCNEWTQTGYTPTVVGMTLYTIIVLEFWIIQFLLFALTVEYCEFLIFPVTPSHCHFDSSSHTLWTCCTDVQQEAITWSIFGTQQFFDEVQVLMAFEIVWMVGFAWSFFIMAPGSIHALFLRSE